MILQGKKSERLIQTVLTLMSVFLICAVLTAAGAQEQRFVLMSVGAVFPQGAATMVREYVGEEDIITTQAVVVQPQSVSSDLTDVPDDIKLLIEDAQRKAVNEKKDGAIREMTYGEKSATDSVNGVLIKDTTEEDVDFSHLLEKPLDLEIKADAPAVLLFHTHTTEGYEILDRDWYACDTSSRTEDASRNIVRVGDAVASELEAAGITVIHDKTIHDRQYNGSYDRSRATVQKHLKENPQIKVVIDIHRDAMQENDGTKIKAVREINGKKAAQIMIISGAEGCKITDFPNWRENLSFALKLHKVNEELTSGIMRPLMFCYRKYNMDETPYSLLVEFGSEANTLDEAVYSGHLFGRALAQLLNEEKNEENIID